MGETPPYTISTLDALESDSTRMSALFAQSSAKHERLVHLVEELEYSFVNVLVDQSDSARARVAKLAAQVAVRKAGNIVTCDTKQPNQVIKKLEQAYRSLYLKDGLNLDIGLTGDKLEAMAVGVFCSKYQPSNVHYVSPSEFDVKRFSKGFGATRLFEVTDVSE